jgi:hypothetical protein
MCRALLVADSGSGISAVLDPFRFIFLNVDLKVVLERDPAGDGCSSTRPLPPAPTAPGRRSARCRTAPGRAGGRCRPC